jgi:hypothetical protein
MEAAKRHQQSVNGTGCTEMPVRKML